jgi:hypothetical protein
MRQCRYVMLACVLAVPLDAQEPSPALTLLGVTPQAITRPGTPKAFQTAILNAVDERGRLQNGVAIDTSPFLVFAGSSLTIDEYRADAVAQLLARTNLSVASTRETSGDAERMAVGAHITLYDAGDPRLDTELDACFDAALPLPAAAMADSSVSDVTPDQAKAVEACRTASARRNWNATSWVIGAGQAWLSSDATQNRSTQDGGGVWTSFAWSFQRLPPQWRRLQQHAQLIVHARYRTNERVTENNVVTVHDRRLYGARLRIGAPYFNGSLELAAHSDTSAGAKTRKRTLLLGVEQRIAEGVWLELALGRELTRAADAAHFVARSTIHWSRNTKAERAP